MKRIYVGDKAISHVLVLEPGDEVIESLLRFATEEELGGGRVWGIGAFESARLGFLDRESGGYEEHVIEEQAELLGLHGNLSMYGGEPRVHVHVVVSLRDGTVRGGHLLEARVWPTLEAFVAESPVPLIRQDAADLPIPVITPPTGKNPA